MKDTQQIRILLVEDSPPDARLLREQFADSGMGERFSHSWSCSLSEAMVELARGRTDVVLLDLMLPDSSGLETFARVHRAYPSVPVVLLTGLCDEGLAARAVRQGAQDYLVKGQFDPSVLVRSVIYAMERSLADRVGRAGRPASAGRILRPQMVGSSEALEEVRSFIAIVAKTSSTSVLITGETGTGKELVANAIHYSSGRRDGPFIKLNCSAIPDTLMEAELFGYEKGAFTDARQSKKGLFELADTGTIFLDEIGDLDIRLQPKLLQVLENRTLRRLGGVEDIRVDVRVIAATNSDLRAMVRDRRFREDLFYRLNVMAVELPPLRERREDIVPIARHFLRESGASGGRPERLTPGCAEALLAYGWPGNIRELKNIIERAGILAGAEDILTEHLQLGQAQPEGGSALDMPGYSAAMSLEELEKAHIRTVLESNAGNITRASKVLGISRFTLRHKARKYGLKQG